MFELPCCLPCHAVAIGELESEGVADEVQQFVRLGEQLLANATEGCPAVLGGLFWIAQHYDFLPNVGQPLAAVLCPTLAVSGCPGRWAGRLRSALKVVEEECAKESQGGQQASASVLTHGL